ncbi:AsnC family transcriptional regulator [Escherichia coli]|uniref:AsnC family transcriptional regulator n=1 Tax=Escherichia coli TaxID=562 RepID=A0A376YC84_ECOLX|nr:AsnC family transcriptional regulator [Escherichia coli]
MLDKIDRKLLALLQQDCTLSLQHWLKPLI